jgi:hypothetical protein
MMTCSCLLGITLIACIRIDHDQAKEVRAILTVEQFELYERWSQQQRRQRRGR